MSNQNHTSISRFLSKVLRHQPELIGIELNSEGWTNIATLIQNAQKHGVALTPEILAEIVENNNKKRFTLSQDGTQIRAAQGHSAKQVHIQYQSVTPPDILYHGTAQKNHDSIVQQGLQAGTRHHVHLSADVETAIKVGSRHGKPIVFQVDCAKMTAAGHAFYLSENQVWLTEKVPPEFVQLMT